MSDPIYLYAATYATEADAEQDYDVLLAAYDDYVVKTYDVALVTKDSDGVAHVSKHEKPTQHAAWTGAAVGALIGILFPPALLATTAVGAVSGGIIGHLWGGMSRSDVKEVGDFLDNGQAALVILAKSELDDIAKDFARSENHMAKKLDKADAKALEKSLKELEK